MGFAVCITFLALQLAPATAHSDTLTIAECVEYALLHSPLIVREECNLNISENNVREAEAAFLPVIETNLTHSKLTKGLETGVESSLLLFGGMERIYNHKMAVRSRSAGRYLLEETKRAVKMDVTERALNLLLARRLRELSMESCRELEAQIERSRRMYEVGEIARSGLLELEAELAAEEMNGIEEEFNERNCTLQLMEAMGSSDEIYLMELTPHEMLGRIDIPSYSHVLENMERDCGILAAEERVRADEFGARATLGAFLPSISLGHSYIQSKGLWQIKISVPVTGLRTAIALRRSAKIKVRESQAMLDERRLALRRTLSTAYFSTMAAVERVKASQKRLSAADESFRIAELKFNQGAAGSTDYIVARSRCRAAQVEHAREVIRLILQAKLLLCLCRD